VSCDDVPVEGMAQAIAASDLVLLEASAASPDGCLAVSGSFAAAVVANRLGVPVWLTLGEGRLLPPELFRALIERAGLERQPWIHDDEQVPVDVFDLAIGPGGVHDASVTLQDVRCPCAPELLKDRRDID
jgi:hypothetical protein